jgi:hypothetical protein
LSKQEITLIDILAAKDALFAPTGNAGKYGTVLGIYSCYSSRRIYIKK